MKRLIISKEEGIFRFVCLSDSPTPPFEFQPDPSRRLKNRIFDRVRRVGREID